MNGDLIEDYLARLRAGLRTPPARTAEIVAEAEDHLRESAAARQAAGLDAAAAERAAIAAFGPVKRVIRAHRPTLAAYAAAAGILLLPLFGWYLLLSALTACALAAIQLVDSHGDIYLAGGGALRIGLARPDREQLAAILGGCVLAGLLVLLGSRRYGRRSVAALVPLPRGFAPVAAAAGLLALAMAQLQDWTAGGLGGLPRLAGTVQLFYGSMYMSVLMGLACVLWALAALSDPGGQPPGHTAAWQHPAQNGAWGYAVEACLKAGQLLGSWVLFSALTGGLLLYVDAVGAAPGFLPDLPLQAALVAGCGLAGALLFAGFRRARGRRRLARPAPARPGPGLSLLLAVAGLAVLAVAEYLFFCGDVMGMLHVPEAVASLILGSQWAVVIMGSVRALRTLAALGRWLAAGSAGKRTPPEGADLAPI